MQSQIHNQTFGVVNKKKTNVFKKAFEGLGRIGKALMFPIAVLPIAAILNRLGAQVPANSNIGNAPEFVMFVQTMLQAAGNTVFNNLHILFAVGVGFGLTKDNRGEAALTALVGMIFLTLIMGSNGADLPNQIYGSIAFETTLKPEGIEPFTGFHRIFGNKYNDIMANNVLNGIIAGALVAFIYNKFNGVELPKILGFFNGRRLIPVLVILSMFFFGILWAIIFPWIGWLLYMISDLLGKATGNRWGNSAIAGTYAFLNRLLIPFGLHHVPNTLFWFVLGEHPSVDGGTAYGDINIFLNGVAEGNTAGTFQSGFFATMMFGLPALTLVFYMNAESKEQKQRVLALFGPAAVVSFLTGITEPIEFAFMFVSPLLYFIHAVLAGVFAFITGLFNIQIGFGFSAGLLDYMLSIPKSMQIIQANKTGVDAVMANPGWLWLIGGLCSVTYFFTGNILVKKLNLATPGRKENLILGDDNSSSNNLNLSGFSDKSKKLVLGLGGWDNIINYQSCTTRLRYDLKDMSKVNEQLLKEGGSMGVKKFQDHHIHVIIGTHVELVNNEIINNKGSDLTLANNNDHSISNNQDKTPKETLKSKITVKSPIAGKVCKLDNMDNGTFSIMGQGIAIMPKKLVKLPFNVPFASKLTLAYRTGHAYVIEKDGVQILIHIGVDTNKINADKSENQKLDVFDSEFINKENINLKHNQTLVTVNTKQLNELGYDSTTAIVALNETLNDCSINILVKENQIIEVDQPLFEIIPKK